MSRSVSMIGAARIAVAALLFCGALVGGPAWALTNEEIFSYQGHDRDGVLEEGARKEGTVVLYSSLIVNQLQRPIAEAFHKKYPFIEVKYWRGGDDDIIAKIKAETQANAVVGDVFEGGAFGSAEESQFTVPFISKYSALLPHDYVAPDRTWITTRLRYIALGYNTRFIAAADAPKTYQDLADPRWKSKMAWAVGSAESGAFVTITALRAAWGDTKIEGWAAQLAPQRVAPLAISNRAVMDAVIAGEYWIGIGISAHHPIISASKGAPATTILLDPVPALSAAVQVLKGAKHPYSAMLLVDFLLSPEAQTMFGNAQYFPSNPEVQPAEMLKPIVPRNAGVPEIAVTPQMLVTDTPKSAALFEKYFR